MNGAGPVHILREQKRGWGSSQAGSCHSAPADGSHGEIHISVRFLTVKILREPKNTVLLMSRTLRPYSTPLLRLTKFLSEVMSKCLGISLLPPMEEDFYGCHSREAFENEGQ